MRPIKINSVIFSKYELRGSGDNLTLVPRRWWPGKLAIRLNDVNLVVIHRDLLVLHHDGGEACLTNPHHPRNQPLFQALYAVHGIHIIESDRDRLLNRRLAQLGGSAFMIITAAFVATAIYLSVPKEGSETGPLAFVLYLLPGFCLAFLARRLIQKII